MTRLILAYKAFPTECSVSHVGLGNAMTGTCHVLRQAGVAVDIWAIRGGDDLLARLATEEQAGRPVTHVVIAALFIPPEWMARLAMRFTDTQFAVNCHSSVGFLQAEPDAIRKLRDVGELYCMFHNLRAAANSRRCVDALREAYGLTPLHLPNLYSIDAHCAVSGTLWRGGTLRIGAFGAARVQKNLTTAAMAAVSIARQLKAQCEFWMNSARGHDPVVQRAIAEVLRDVPYVTFKQLEWAPPARFREVMGSMHLLLQPSYTESFNLTAADAVAMGVPVVAGEAIDWLPRRWIANVDNVTEMAATGRQLIADGHAGREGIAALQACNDSGVYLWKEFLGVSL